MSEARFKKGLRDLTEQILSFENAMEEIMKTPESNERGQRIAKALNALTFSNQAAMHFVLGLTMKQVENRYKKGAK